MADPHFYQQSQTEQHTLTQNLNALEQQRDEAFVQWEQLEQNQSG